MAVRLPLAWLSARRHADAAERRHATGPSVGCDWGGVELLGIHPGCRRLLPSRCDSRLTSHVRKGSYPQMRRRTNIIVLDFYIVVVTSFV